MYNNKMIEVLISLVIFVIVYGLIYYLVMLIPLPAPFNKLVQIGMILIAVIYLLGFLGGFLPEPVHYHAAP